MLETFSRVWLVFNLLFQTAVIVTMGYSVMRVFWWIMAVICIVVFIESMEKLKEIRNARFHPSSRSK